MGDQLEPQVGSVWGAGIVCAATVSHVSTPSLSGGLTGASACQGVMLYPGDSRLIQFVQCRVRLPAQAQSPLLCWRLLTRGPAWDETSEVSEHTREPGGLSRDLGWGLGDMVLL